ncbi:MAG: carbohydrate ABC transporter permease [Oscillospiraceae bacterium]|nr:carbohydrate ABC transporter permease [Oscillospiraceae bacterium]
MTPEHQKEHEKYLEQYDSEGNLVEEQEQASEGDTRSEYRKQLDAEYEAQMKKFAKQDKTTATDRALAATLDSVEHIVQHKDTFQKAGTVTRSIAAHALCVVLTVICVIPFVIMFVNTTKSAYELNQGETNFLANFVPSTYLKSNFEFLKEADAAGLSIQRAFVNSLIIAVCAMGINVYISALTAYGFTVYTFKGRDILFVFVLLFMMIPAQTSIVAFYGLLNTIGWTEEWKSFLGLIIPAGVAPPTVFFLRQYMKSVLRMEMIEAARIDGYSEVGIFHRVAFPILKPGVAVMAIFAVVGSWNNLFMPMVVLSGEWRTIPVYVSLLSGSRHHIETGAIFLGLSLTAIPLLVFYLLLSKNIISGVSLGGLSEE